MSNSTRALLTLAAAVAIVVAPGAHAGARDISPARLEELAERASTDPGALELLTEVDSVSGRPVDLGRALGGASGEELEGRLDALTAPAAASSTDPSAARTAARSLLAQGRFQERTTPRPLRGVLEWLGDRLEPVTGLGRRIFDALASVLPGGASAVWALLALGVVASSGAFATLLARRGTRASRRATEPRARAAGRGPDELERAAEEAERTGRLDEALRLRFLAGLLRLDGAGAVSFRPSLTSGEVARRLRSPAFDALAHDLDEVVYGGRPPAPTDVARARRVWPEVLAGSGTE